MRKLFLVIVPPDFNADNIKDVLMEVGGACYEPIDIIDLYRIEDDRRTTDEVDRELEICYQLKDRFDSEGIGEESSMYMVCLAQIRLFRWFKGESLKDIALEMDGVLLE